MKYTLILFVLIGLVVISPLQAQYKLSDTTLINSKEIASLLPHSDQEIDSAFTLKRLDSHPFIENVEIHRDSSNPQCLVISFDTSETYKVSYLGGGLKNKKHGKTGSFPRILLEAELRKNSFMETLSTFAIRAGGWSDRFLRATWMRPLTYKTDLTLRSEIGHFPSEIDRWTLKFYNRNSIELRIINSPYLSITPTVTPNYYHYDNLDSQEDTYTELTTAVDITFDKRDNSLNPRSGFYASGELFTNAIYPYQSPKKKYRHLTFIYEIAAYLPLWNAKHTLCAYFSQNSVLAGSIVPYERLYLGGTKNVRGFETGSFGHHIDFENRIESTLAYRFSLFRIPTIKLPFLKWYNKNFKDFPVDVDGGLFLDGGYLWPELPDLFKQRDSYSAFSGGIGLRISLPTVDILGAIDVAVPLYATIKPEKKPHLHIYLRLPF